MAKTQTVIQTTAAPVTKQTAKPVAKPSTRSANKAATNKAVAGLSIAAIAKLDAFAARFLTRAIGYHEAAGSITLTADGNAKLTAKGINKMKARKGLANALEKQTKGADGYTKSPAGFAPAVKFIFPFGRMEEGTTASQSAFAALMLAHTPGAL